MSDEARKALKLHIYRKAEAQVNREAQAAQIAKSIGINYSKLIEA